MKKILDVKKDKVCPKVLVCKGAINWKGLLAMSEAKLTDCSHDQHTCSAIQSKPAGLGSLKTKHLTKLSVRWRDHNQPTHLNLDRSNQACLMILVQIVPCMRLYNEWGPQPWAPVNYLNSALTFPSLFLVFSFTSLPSLSTIHLYFLECESSVRRMQG